MSSVEARFFVASTEEFGKPDDAGNCSGSVTLRAVSRGDQNRQWASATPSGELKMYVNNGAAFEAIRAWQREGKDVQLLITPVIAHTADDGHEFRPSRMDDSSCYGGPNTCGDCGQKRSQTYDKNAPLVTHAHDRDVSGWQPE